MANEAPNSSNMPQSSNSPINSQSEVSPRTRFRKDVLLNYSIFNTVESLTTFRADNNLSKAPSESNIISEPCEENELVYMGRAPTVTHDYFYMYAAIFKQIRLRLPFSTFECAVMKILNVAPSQIHPNSWGFIRSFAILCRYLKIAPTTSQFFSFFQVKLSKQLCWVSLNSLPKRAILTPFSPSFKGFKTGFFRVRGSDALTEFFKNSKGEPKFPLYWTREPNSKASIEYHKLEPRERHIVDFLEKFPPFSCQEIIRLGGDEMGLKEYMGRMAPRLDSKTLKEYLGKKMAKLESAAKGQAAQNLPTLAAPSAGIENRKRTRDNANLEVEVKSHPREHRLRSPARSLINLSSADHGENLSRPRATNFQQFEGATGDPVSSLWDTRFSAGLFVDQHLTFNQDFARFNSAGPEFTSQVVTAWNLKAASASRFMELEIVRLKELLQKKDLEINGFKEKLSRVTDLEENLKATLQQNEELKSKKRSLSKSKDKLIEEKDLLSKNLETEKKLRIKDQEEFAKMREKLEADIEEYKCEAAFQYSVGFNTCYTQVTHICPDVDFSEVGMFKSVKDGRIVPDNDIEATKSVPKVEGHAGVKEEEQGDTALKIKGMPLIFFST